MLSAVELTLGAGVSVTGEFCGGDAALGGSEEESISRDLAAEGECSLGSS